MQANENIGGDFPYLGTLKSWLLQDCSTWVFQVNLPGVTRFQWILSLKTYSIAKRTAAS